MLRQTGKSNLIKKDTEANKSTGEGTGPTQINVCSKDISLKRFSASARSTPYASPGRKKKDRRPI